MEEKSEVEVAFWDRRFWKVEVAVEVAVMTPTVRLPTVVEDSVMMVPVAWVKDKSGKIL